MNKLSVVCGVCVSFVCEVYADNSNEYWIQKVCDYFDSLDSVEVSFIQEVGGRSVPGKIWIKRPDVIKFYVGNLTVVAQKNSIVQYDSRLKERTEIKKNPYAVFLKKKVGEIFKIRHVEKKKNSLTISGGLNGIIENIVISFDIKAQGNIAIREWHISGRSDVTIKIRKITPITCSNKDLLDYSKK